MTLLGHEDKGVVEIVDKKEDKLDLGCVEWSLVEDEKAIDAESEIDR